MKSNTKISIMIHTLESNVKGHRIAYKSDNIDCLWNARCTHERRKGKNNV